MKHVWSVACLRSVIDSDSNSISLIDVLEQINFAAEGEVKGLPARLEVVSMWWRSDPNQPEKNSGRMQILSPKDELLIQLDADLDLTEYRRLRHRWQLMGIPFTESGVYRFTVEFEVNGQWQTAASIPLEIIRDYPEGNPA